MIYNNVWNYLKNHCIYLIIVFIYCILLTSIVNASDHMKFFSLNNQNFKIQPILITSHPNIRSLELN